MEKKILKKRCFLRVFWIFFNLRAILALQTSCSVLSWSWRIFWHPWDPWVRINSGDISFFIFVFDFSVWQSHLVDFFHNSQIEARCHLYWFDMHKNENITFCSHNGWFFKMIQAVSAVIWMEIETISPVWYGFSKPKIRTIFQICTVFRNCTFKNFLKSIFLANFH